MSVICISALRMENNNINTRKKFKVINFLQQHSDIVSTSYHLAWISYYKTKKEPEGKPTSSDKIALFFYIKPILFNLSHLKTNNNIFLLSICLSSMIFS